MKNTLILSIISLLVAFNAQVLPYLPADMIICVDPMYCPKLDAEYASICAWYDSSKKTDCSNSLCNEEFKFTCDICTTKKAVIGYTLGACPPSDPVIPVDPNVCTKAEKLATVCTTIYQPVCGTFDQTKIQCKGIFCGKTYPNRCSACQDPDVYSVTQGECQELHPIDPLPPVPVNPFTLCLKKSCPKIYKPVCAYYNLSLVSCKKNNCRITMANACEACKDPKIIGYVDGPCPKIVIGPLPVDVLPDLTAAANKSEIQVDSTAVPIDSLPLEDASVEPVDASVEPVDASEPVDAAIAPIKVPIDPFPVDYLCTDALRAMDCSTYVGNDVCAIGVGNACTVQGKTSPCYSRIGNACETCKDPNVHAYNIYMIGNGTCPKKSPYPANMIKCKKFICPPTKAPVCAIQLPCSVTKSNSCYACLDPNTLGYVNGPCPKPTPVPEPVFTEYVCTKKDLFDGKECPEKGNHPFYCAHLNLKCIYGQCTTYYSTLCDACHNHLVASVTPGLCPKEQKHFDNIESYECRPEDRDNKCTQAKFGVCGIKSQGMENYANTCTACLDKDVKVVYDKECPSF